MLLISTKVGPFKSINVPQTVLVDKSVTVLVGMNEAGKTVFLQALQKSNDALSLADFDPVDDYPRKDLPAYLKRHKTQPEEVTTLTYGLNNDEIAEINNTWRTNLPSGFKFAVTHLYDDSVRVSLNADEKPVIDSIAADKTLSSDVRSAIKKTKLVRSIPDTLKDLSLTKEDEVLLTSIKARIAKTKWDSVVSWEIWEWLKGRIPKFLYFSDYDLLPSKMNLADLAQRAEQSKTDSKSLQPKHRAVLALLRMADISITDFAKPGGYEQLKAKIEGVSISLTDQIMEFWKQNEDLEVEVDIKSDPDDEAPYNNGTNMYLRIKNRRHRGISTPFQQRSRGFIWFFSFLVWFDSVQHQIDTTSKAESKPIILLLDEPGLALHALAQKDLLRYIDELSKKHQVLYTTHSPFLVHSDRLHQVRMVEDKDNIGTVISENISGSDPRTIFPLQAALGWTIAQNLFISERNLLVEGSSDLIYLRTISSILEARGKVGLRDDVTIVPVGGLDKVVTFIALLGANGLKLAVFHDYRGGPEQKLMDLVKEKIVLPKALLNASQFRDLTKIGKNGVPSDTEDLFPPAFYVDQFNKTFVKEMSGKTIGEADLPAGDRIVERLERHIKSRSINIRPSGGFNHHAVASYIAVNGATSIDDETMARFEVLFVSVNSLL